MPPQQSNLTKFMTKRIYSSVLLRTSLVMIPALLLLATSVDVRAQSPSISVRDVTVAEGNSGTTQATFVVALSGPSSQSVSFSFATANGTATAGSDYVATSGASSFAPGEVEKPVVVLVMEILSMRRRRLCFWISRMSRTQP